MNRGLRGTLDELFRTRNYSDEGKAEFILEQIHKAVKNRLPKMLYRYRRCSRYSISGFRKDTVTAVSPLSFNDPYDCLLRYDLPRDGGKMNKASFEKIVHEYLQTGLLPRDFEYYMPENVIQDFKGILEDYLTGKWTYDESSNNASIDRMIVDKIIDPCSILLQSNTRVSCFSERKDSILMWSHYADEHKGFVLGYDLRDDINKHIIDYLYPVIYSNKRYDASEAVRFLVGELIHMQHNENNDLLFPIAASLYKSKDWSYEREWRVVSYDNEEKLVEFKLRPSCIFYGSRINPNDFDKLHKIATANGIKEHKAIIDKGSLLYNMKMVRL